jgi:hypothetical protein
MSNTINTSTAKVQPQYKKENKKTQSKTEQKVDKTEKPKTETTQTDHKIDTNDKTAVSQDAKEDKGSKEESPGVFSSLWDYATGKQDDSSSLLNQDKVKEFEEKLQKEDPGKYKKYKEDQSSSDKKIKEAEDRSYLDSMGVKYDSTGGPDEKKVKEFEDKLQKEDPGKYKKYKENQDKSDKSINDSMTQSKETMKEGLKKSDYYFNADHLLKSGITGVDQYELDKGNKESEKFQMDLAKDKHVNKEHVKNILHSQGEINKSNLESAEATQNIADTADTFTMGASGKFVEAGQEFKQGNYKEAALDGLEGLGRCAIAAVAMAPEKVIGPAYQAVSPAIGQMTKWGDDVLKVAGKFGDDAVKGAVKFGDDAVKGAVKFGDDTIKGAVKFGDDIVQGAGKFGDDIVQGMEKTLERVGKYVDDARETRKMAQNKKKLLEMLGDVKKEGGVLDKGKQIASEGIKDGKNIVSKGADKGKELVSEGINYVKDGAWSTRESYEKYYKALKEYEKCKKYQ